MLTSHNLSNGLCLFAFSSRSFATNRLDQVFNIYDLEVILSTVGAVYFTL